MAVDGLTRGRTHKQRAIVSVAILLMQVAGTLCVSLSLEAVLDAFLAELAEI